MVKNKTCTRALPYFTMYKDKLNRPYYLSVPCLLFSFLVLWILTAIMLLPHLFRYDSARFKKRDACNVNQKTSLHNNFQTSASTESSFNSETAVAPPKYSVTVCTIVRNQASRLVEWIEFHRLQGVNHFVIYDDNSVDGLALISQLYEQIGEPDLIEVFPSAVADFVFDKNSVDEYRNFFRRRQLMCYTHCTNHVNTSTEWFLVIDVDEYVFGVKKTLAEELRDPKWRDVASITLHNTVFGTNAVEKALQVFFRLNPETGNVVLQYASAEKFYKLPESQKHVKDPFPLLIEANPNRMPYNELDGSVGVAPPTICATWEGMWRIECPQKYGKYLIRPNVCITIANHWCEEFVYPYEERYVSPSTAEIRLHHYYIRSKEEFYTMKGWSRAKIDTFNIHDKNHLSSVLDTTLIDRFASTLRERITLFLPQKVSPVERLVGWMT